MKKKLLLLTLPFLLNGCSSQKKLTPLGWCLSEISTNYGYREGFTFTYQELSSYKKEKNNKYTDGHFYAIQTYCDDFKTEWLCYIETKRTTLRFVPRSYVLSLDCDEIYTMEYNL